MMGQFEQLDQMLTEQEGMLRTSQVVSSGISKPVFYDYVRSRDLDRVAHGIYLSKDSRSEEHSLNSSHKTESRMPSSA